MRRDQRPSKVGRRAKSRDLGCGTRRSLVADISLFLSLNLYFRVLDHLDVSLVRQRVESIPVLSTRQLSGSLVEMLPWKRACAGVFVEGSAGS